LISFLILQIFSAGFVFASKNYRRSSWQHQMAEKVETPQKVAEIRSRRAG
jgi:hypothetical protein